MPDSKEPQDLDFYHQPKETSASSGIDRDEVRNIVLAELKNFRDYLSAPWGGLGSGNTVNADGLFGFFAKQQYGSYYQSPHTVQATGQQANGNDFGRIFVEAENDQLKTAVVTITNASPAVVTWNSHGLPIGALVKFTTTGALPNGIFVGVNYYIISAGYGANSFRVSQIQGGSAVNTTTAGSGTHTGHGYAATPSWSFDLPTYAQKMLIKSTGPGLVYDTLTSPFTAGTVLTGGTSGATATITAIFPDGASTDGTLYLANIVGTFVAGETITDTGGGSATIFRLTTTTNAIQRIYGVGGENVDTPGLIYSFWGLTDLYAPIGLFNQPSAANTTLRDIELIPAFAANGVMYIRNTAGTRALRIYLNGSWQTII